MVNHYFKLLDITNYEFDPFLARGLDYYTGIIYEIVVGDNNNSVAGGGRYDDLISSYRQSETKIPAIGISFGIYRLINILIDDFTVKENKRIFIANIDKGLLNRKIEIYNILIENGFNVDMFFDDKHIKQQLKYCNQNNIRYVLILANKEMSEGYYLLKDMVTKIQSTINIDLALQKIDEIVNEKNIVLDYKEFDPTKLSLTSEHKPLTFKLPFVKFPTNNEEHSNNDEMKECIDVLTTIDGKLKDMYGGKITADELRNFKKLKMPPKMMKTYEYKIVDLGIEEFKQFYFNAIDNFANGHFSEHIKFKIPKHIQETISEGDKIRIKFTLPDEDSIEHKQLFNEINEYLHQKIIDGIIQPNVSLNDIVNEKNITEL